MGVKADTAFFLRQTTGTNGVVSPPECSQAVYRALFDGKRIPQ